MPDAAEYFCRAENMVGIKDSAVATLSVYINTGIESCPGYLFKNHELLKKMKLQDRRIGRTFGLIVLSRRIFQQNL